MSRRFSVFRLIIWTIAAVLLFFVSIVILNIAFGQGAALVQWELVFGWLGFIRRVASQAEFRWLPMLFYSVGAMIVLEGAHRFFAWLYTNRHQPETSSTYAAGPRWHRRWTLGICGLVLTSAFIAMAGLGIIHQTGWMIASNEPTTIKVSDLPIRVARDADLEIEMAATDGIDVRTDLETLGRTLREAPWWKNDAQGYRVFLLTNATSRPGLLIFRDPSHYQSVQWGFGVVSEGGDQLQFRYDELPAMLARYSDRMYPIQ